MTTEPPIVPSLITSSASDWIELDSHSDLVFEHDLDAMPTLVVVKLGRPDSKLTHHRRPTEITPVGPTVTVGRRTVRVEQTTEIRRLASEFHFNRYRVYVMHDPSAVKTIGSYRQVKEAARDCTSAFLDALYDIEAT